MSDFFQKYPEVLLSDATYEVNDVDMLLYTQVISGNMETRPVCFFLVLQEDEESLRDMQVRDFFHIINHTHINIYSNIQRAFYYVSGGTKKTLI